ncbi:hypothetical protein XENOCAPTIV_003114, partial [Xenoophorus captivus]
GATDSEKRVLCLSAENESLKQSLSVTQGLLQQLTTIPSQSSTMLIKVGSLSSAQSSHGCSYEREIGKLREELLKEIGHLEERKEEAVKAAASCSAEHFQNLQDQFFTLQKRLTALPPTLRSMKTDYASLRSQVRNFSEFYGAAINEAKKQEIEPLVTSCIDGYHVCIFAYGQTGSGKTYTMEARVRDLLSKDGEKLDIKINPDGTGQLHVPGLRVIEVRSFQHIKKVIRSLTMNQHSSRSHALLCITVQGTDLASGSKTTGQLCFFYSQCKMNLVDLAGSERVWKSGAEGERLKEAQNINRSLLALGDVIQALRGRHTHIPFRNSRLTYLLQDSLGKGSKTVMVVQRVCKVELGPAARKIESGGGLCD